jgi:hypothetical protein
MFSAMIERDRGGPGPEEPDTRVRPNPDFDPVLHAHPDSDVSLFEVENPSWSFVGVARERGEGEEVFELHRSGIVWREIDDASQLDPPKNVSSDSPRRCFHSPRHED